MNTVFLCLCFAALTTANDSGDSIPEWQQIEPLAETDSGGYMDYGESSSVDQDPVYPHIQPAHQPGRNLKAADPAPQPGNLAGEEPYVGRTSAAELQKFYCSTNCGQRHLACGPIKFGDHCPRSTSIVEVGSHKHWILQLHNVLRNKVASGQGHWRGLPMASRMGEMMWDEELAALATVYAMQCQLHFETCYTTARFPYLGRNSALYKTARKRSLRELIQGRIEYWFQQLDDVMPHYIERYPSKKPTAPISSVTVAINEKSNHIGCGAVEFQDNDMYNFLFVCFYSYTNVHEANVYTIGQPASQCQSGISKLYPYLCNVDEPYSYD